MNTERLLRLADYLEDVVAKLPAERFDMNNWATPTPHCGTACCAVGHACSIPEFQAAGLAMSIDEEGHGEPVIRPDDGSMFSSWQAVEAFFGITHREAACLFDAGRYFAGVRPQEVAARIRQFVASGSTGLTVPTDIPTTTGA